MNPNWRDVLTSLDYFLATGFGSGLAPKAPGTFGSLVALVLFPALSMFGWLVYAVIVAVALAAGVYLCGRVADKMSIKDPSVIVLDEFVGLWIALLFVPDGWIWLLIGFLLFRFFDILKPWPIRWCEQSLGGGWGIVMDDVMAGVFALLVLHALAFSWSLL
ncbi:MAG: phosphatidylglycerophosphatase A [Gammaproteobacteria bacterium]|nr:phosphatidylglycerophosphatase A [Gammaproteobacteria bacterium]